MTGAHAHITKCEAAPVEEDAAPTIVVTCTCGWRRRLQLGVERFGGRVIDGVDELAEAARVAAAWHRLLGAAGALD